jgi:hypothetical protein
LAKSLKGELCGPRVFSPGLWSRASKSQKRINRGIEELRGIINIVVSIDILSSKSVCLREFFYFGSSVGCEDLP